MTDCICISGKIFRLSDIRLAERYPDGSVMLTIHWDIELIFQGAAADLLWDHISQQVTHIDLPSSQAA